MQIDDPRQTLNGSLRRTAPLLAALLSVSLIVSLQPCCELFISLFTPHGVESSAAPDGGDHAHGPAAPLPAKAGDSCGHGASSPADLAKAVPAIPVKAASSFVGAVSVIAASWEFASVPRLLLSPAFHPSPPPFRVYLRFLHLLM